MPRSQLTPDEIRWMYERQAQGNYNAFLLNASWQANAALQAAPPFGPAHQVAQQPVAPVPIPGFGPIPEPPVVLKEDEEMKLINPFLIGCDPEFVVLDAAGKHLMMNGTFTKAGLVGWDHSGHVLEVRPAPARSAATLLRHIQDLFINTKFPGSKLRAGALIKFKDNAIGLGGHVHLDLPYSPELNPAFQKQIDALDAFTKLLVHRDILPKAEFEARRAWGLRYGYGGYGSYRRADNADRYEYRTMASWLFSPITSYVCLTGAKLAAAQPDAVMEALSAPKAKLTKMFSRFANEDMDAARVSELILENGVKLQRDPDANLLTVWDKNSPELKTLEIHD